MNAWSHDQEAVWEENDGVIYAVAATDGELLILDGVAAAIFTLADGATTDEIVAALVESTGEQAETVAPAVDTFLTDLESRSLIAHG